MNTWINAPETAPDDKEGFVYAVTRVKDGITYYGIKKYWKTVRLPMLKGRTKAERERTSKLKGRKRLVRKETDWRTYTTSNEFIQKELENNPKLYRCEILYECDSVTELKAREAYIQLTEYINGRWDSVFNEVINLRLRIRKENKK